MPRNALPFPKDAAPVGGECREGVAHSPLATAFSPMIGLSRLPACLSRLAGAIRRADCGDSAMKPGPFLSMRGRQWGTLLGLLILCLVLWVLTPYFLTLSNLLNIVEQSSVIAIMAAGMTFVIITAGIDLSVGSVLALSGVVMASLLQAGVPLPLAVSAGLGSGFLCGLLNGVLITRGRLPPLFPPWA